MVALFVSHSGADNADAVRVGHRLEAAGFVSLFLDFDPSRGIPGGRSWEHELYSQLRRTDAVIFLASPASVASRWCFAELCLARSLGKPVLPLRLHGDVMLDLLSDIQWIDWNDEASALARLLGGLRLAGLDPTDSFAWDPRRAPYPGLQAFMAEDAGVFFGRDHEIDRLEEHGKLLGSHSSKDQTIRLWDVGTGPGHGPGSPATPTKFGTRSSATTARDSPRPAPTRPCDCGTWPPVRQSVSRSPATQERLRPWCSVRATTFSRP